MTYPIRKQDLRWLLMASHVDPDFGSPVVWADNPTGFGRLRAAGYVEQLYETTRRGGVMKPRITEAGRQRIESMRAEKRRALMPA